MRITEVSAKGFQPGTEGVWEKAVVRHRNSQAPGGCSEPKKYSAARSAKLGRTKATPTKVNRHGGLQFISHGATICRQYC